MRKGDVVSTAAALLVLCSWASAAQEELLDQARKLVADAKPFVAAANDVDAELVTRKAPRKEAFKRLKEARGFYDRYLDANPTKEESLDKEYVEMMVLLHGIKKDSAIGELERDETAPAATDAAKPAEGDAGKPADAGSTAPPAGETPPPTPAAPDAAARAKQRLAEVQAF